MEVYSAGLEGRQHGLPGEICPCPVKRVLCWRQDRKQRQKSAEVILGDCTITEGPNCKARIETGVSNGVEMQKQQQLEAAQQTGRNSVRSAASHQASMATKEPSIHEGVSLEQMLSPENMKRAWKQVKRNKGAAGVDGLTIEAAVPYLQ